MPDINDVPTNSKTNDNEPVSHSIPVLPDFSGEDCVPFPDDSDIPKYRPFYFESYGMPSIKASVFERADIEEEFPFLSEMFELEPRPGSRFENEERGKVIIVAQKDFPRLFYPEFCEDKPTGAALVILLSDQFEPYAEALAGNCPAIMNSCSTDLMHCATNFYWEAVSDEKCLSVEIFERAVDHVLRLCSVRDWNQTLLGQFIPVLTVSGNTVACGGFWNDSSFAMEHQCASVTSFNHNPYRLFSDEELQEAKERADSGNLEFEEDIAETGVETVTIRPPVFDCTDWFNATE